MNSMRAQDSDRVCAEPHESGVPEGHERAVADQQVERERRDCENHYAGDEAEHIGFRPECGE